jgi:hypothetical protein
MLLNGMIKGGGGLGKKSQFHLFHYYWKGCQRIYLNAHDLGRHGRLYYYYLNTNE